MITKIIKSMLALIAVVGFTAAHAGAAEPAQPKLIGLMFYADTCATCKVLDPKIESVKSDYATKPILFAKLDHSDDASKNQAALLAGSLGVDEVYKAQEKASGFLLIVDADSKEVVGKLTRDMTEAEIEAAFDKALAEG